MLFAIKGGKEGVVLMKSINAYDSTLRDGAQAQGISFSVEDKLKIIKKLDEMGIKYIEAGNPGSNPKDLEFFDRVKEIKLENSKLIAFGSTRRANINVEDDNNVNSLLGVNTKAVAIFGKAWDFHVIEVLKTTLEENLKMIYDTIKFFKDKGKEVVFDAEHFFDGYKANEEYALKTLDAAFKAGADTLCLCETNGGCFPNEIFDITKKMVEKYNVEIGIHCHNDNGMAVANSVVAVQAGAIQVQGTMNGIGERCGNANLCSIIPNLQIKLGFDVIPEASLRNLAEASVYMSEVSNLIHDERAPYVGKCAFTHKAGMHADAVHKNTQAYENISPELVGNERIFVMSEVAGRSTVMKVINKIDPSISKDSPESKKVLKKLKEMEYKGYQYEAAETSFELLVKKVLGKHEAFFDLKKFKVIVNNESEDDHLTSSAIIKIKVGDEYELTAAEGDGPVNALDKALRKALERFYPEIAEVKLTDYKVRVLDSNLATASKVRVLIESADGKHVWTTIGVSTDIIRASWEALVDSVEYKLMLEAQKNTATSL